MNWLFLRGLARDQRHWDEFPNIFSSINPGKIHFLDLPGTGKAKHVDAPITITEATDWLRSEWLKLTTFSEPWTILGISLGGMITMDWISRFKDFERAVIINTSSRDSAAPWERLKIDIIPFFAAAALGTDPVERELNILKMTTNMQKDIEERARKWADYHNTAHPLSLRTVFKQMRSAISFHSPDSLHCPSLFMASEADQMVSPKASQYLAEKFKAPLIVHPDAGHDLPLDAPHWVANQVKLWIKK